MRRSRQRMSVVALLVGPLAWRQSAEAQAAADIALRWVAPEGCSSEAEIVEATRVLLRGSKRPGAARAQATVTRETDGSVRVALSSADGERDLRAESCAAAADAVALILALSVDPELTSPPPASSQPERAPDPPPSRQDDIAPWGGHLGITADVGTMPAVAWGLDAALGWRGQRAWLEAGGALFLDQEQQNARGIGGDFSLVSGAVRAGVAWSWGHVRLGPTTGLGLHHMAARSAGATTPGRGTFLWLSPAAGLRFTWLFTRNVSFTWNTEALVHLSRPAFLVENEGIVHRPATASVRGFAAIDVHFP